MAMQYCTTCDDYIDLDYEDGFNMVNGTYMCQACCLTHLPEWVLDELAKFGIAEYDPND